MQNVHALYINASRFLEFEFRKRIIALWKKMSRESLGIFYIFVIVDRNLINLKLMSESETNIDEST